MTLQAGTHPDDQLIQCYLGPTMLHKDEVHWDDDERPYCEICWLYIRETEGEDG